MMKYGHLLSYKQYIVQYDTINFSHVEQIWIHVITDVKDLFYLLLKYSACNITESKLSRNYRNKNLVW